MIKRKFRAVVFGEVLDREHRGTPGLEAVPLRIRLGMETREGAAHSSTRCHILASFEMSDQKGKPGDQMRDSHTVVVCMPAAELTGERRWNYDSPMPRFRRGSRFSPWWARDAISCTSHRSTAR